MKIPAKHLYNLLLQASLTGLVFLSSILLAQILGKAAFGTYTWLHTLVQFLSILALFGTDDLLLQQYPLLPQAQHLWHWIIQRLRQYSLIAIAIGLALFAALSPHQSPLAFCLLLFQIPLLAYLQAFQTLLRSQQHILLGQTTEKILQPLLFTLFLGLFYLFPHDASLDWSIGLRLGSFALALLPIYAYARHRRYLPATPQSPQPDPSWPKTSRQFLWNTLLFLLSTRLDLLLLGLLQDPAELAIYNVALKLSDLALIPFIAVSAFAPTRFSTLHQAQNIPDFQRYYTQITRFCFLATALLSVLLLALAPFILLWYGKDFQESYPSFSILLIARLAHAFIGPASLLLLLCGQSGQVARAQLQNLALLCFSYPLAIFWGGAMGTALITCLGLLWLEWRFLRLAQQQLGLNLLAFGRLPQ